MNHEPASYPQCQQFLDHCARVIGLRLCFHARVFPSRLPGRYHRHLHPACAKAREGKAPARCVEFDAYEVHLALKEKPEGRVHTCPYGLTEIAVPVTVEMQFAGILFAGPCWRGPKPCPYTGLTVAKSDDWLEARRTMLQAVAQRFASLIQVDEASRQAGSSRKTMIINYIRQHLDGSVTVDKLASRLSLSPSRTSHVVNGLFHMSLPNLVNAMKLEQATHLLSATELSIGEIAQQFGFDDQNYFTRLFKQKYGISPSSYRRQHPFQV